MARGKQIYTVLYKNLLLLWRSVWAFPAIVLIIFCLLVAFKVSGSSVGIYHQYLYGENRHDPDLLYGNPYFVRADEWQSATHLIVAQKYNSFHKTNPNIGTGTNLALQTEVPYKDWTIVFRPHTWGYFVLGLERGFSFGWWLPMVLLLLGAYFFALRIFKDKRLLATLFSASVGLSPFLFWWYKAGTLEVIAFGFIALVLIQRILSAERIKYIHSLRTSQIVQVLLLAFVLCCFGLLFYPPFQIPIALVVGFYTIGYVLMEIFDKGVNKQVIGKRVALLVVAGLSVAVVGALFYLSNKAPINALSQSIYPGKRVVESGSLPTLHLFNGYLMPLQEKGVVLFRNLSESASFILPLPLLLMATIPVQIYEYTKRKRLDWIFLLMQLCAALFVIRTVVPFGDPLYRLFLLDRVPNQRLVIGIGFISLVLFLLLLKKIQDLKLQEKTYQLSSLLFANVSLAIMFTVSIYAITHFHQLEPYWLLISLFTVMICGIFVFALANKPYLTLGLLLIFSLGSSFWAMPLYKGLGILNSGELVTKMREVSKPQDTWATIDNIFYENFGIDAGRRNISGIQIYPDKKLWSQIQGKKYEPVYNREGHALYTTEPLKDDLVLVKANLFKVKFYCSSFITSNVDFTLSTKPLVATCLKPVDVVKYPKTSFYIYRVSH